MPLARFIPGTPVRYADRDYLIHKVLGVEALILLDEADGTLRTVTPLAVEFIPAVQAAGLHPVAMPDLGSPEDAEGSVQRLGVQAARAVSEQGWASASKS